MTRLPRRHAASRPSRGQVRVNVGTNAAVIAPSANRSRTQVGDAERDVERVHLRCRRRRYAASTASRTSPSTRLAIVAMPMSPADRARRELIGSGGERDGRVTTAAEARIEPFSVPHG